MKKVIICDDNEKSIFELREMIDQLFPNLFVISGYVSARQLIYEVEDEFLKSADILFVDVEMKEMEGTKVAKILQKKMPMLKIIFITGYPERTEKIFDEIDPFGLLLKPFCRERLEKCLKRELESVYERISRFCFIYEEDFVRCHQSYAVNWGQVAEVSTNGILLKNGEKIPISRQKYREVRSRIL